MLKSSCQFICVRSYAVGVGAAAKPPVGTVLKPYKGCFRADYRLPLQK